MGYRKGPRFPADALKTARTHSCPHTLWDSASLRQVERTSLDKFAHAHSFLPLVRNTGVSRAPPPSSTQPTLCALPALPYSLPCVSLEGPWRCSRSTCWVSPSLALGTFSSVPEAWKGTRQIKSFAHHLYPLPTTSIPRGKKKKQNKNKKKSFVQRYIFIIQSLYSTKKRHKKGVHFFSLL